MKEIGCSKESASNVVCRNSTMLGHYSNSTDAKRDFELTDSRRVGGKCDLANTYKVLAKDEEAGGFWRAGGCYDSVGNYNPLARLELYCGSNYNNHYGVGWFVI